MKLEDLKKKKPPELLAFAEEQGVEGAAQMRRQELMFAILQKLAAALEVTVADLVIGVSIREQVFEAARPLDEDDLRGLQSSCGAVHSVSG